MDKLQCESRPCVEVDCINGLGPGGGVRAESGAAQELHEIVRCHHSVGTVSLDICWCRRRERRGNSSCDGQGEGWMEVYIV